MDPIVTVLVTTAAGALIGTSVGVLIMRRQVRPLITEAELGELKSSLQQSESSLSAATTVAEGLGKQVAQRDNTIQQASEDLKQKQRQLDLLLAEAQAETVRRSAAEQEIQELSTQTRVLTEQCMRLDARAGQQEKELTQKATQIASLQGELHSGKRYAEEMKEQLARVAAESMELLRSKEQEDRYRSSLEAQLRAEQEQIGQLYAKIEELRSERAQLEIQLQEERASTAKGMELLVMAQEKLAGVFKPVGPDAQGAGRGSGTIAPPEVDAEVHAKIAGGAQSIR
jgi:chromosome segregation ATPase